MNNFFKALAHDSTAKKLESTADRMEQEFGDTAGTAHKLRLEARGHRVESDIAKGKIKPINSEYVD